MTQLELAGFEHLPSTSEISDMLRLKFENIQVAIDDLYTDWVLQDYQVGDESKGMFFDEGFEIAVEAYEIETGVSVSADDKKRIKNHILQTWAHVEKHGFDELLVDDNEKLIAEKGVK